MEDEAGGFVAWKCHSLVLLPRTQSRGPNLTTKGGEISSSCGPNREKTCFDEYLIMSPPQKHARRFCN